MLLPIEPIPFGQHRLTRPKRKERKDPHLGRERQTRQALEHPGKERAQALGGAGKYDACAVIIFSRGSVLRSIMQRRQKKAAAFLAVFLHIPNFFYSVLSAFDNFFPSTSFRDSSSFFLAFFSQRQKRRIYTL